MRFENKTDRFDDEFISRATAYMFCVVLILLCLTLWWKTMRAEDELQIVRAMTERNNELLLDLRQEVVAQADRDEKRTKQIIDQVHRAVNGEAW